MGETGDRQSHREGEISENSCKQPGKQNGSERAA